MVEYGRVESVAMCRPSLCAHKDSEMDFLGHLAAGMGAEAGSCSILVSIMFLLCFYCFYVSLTSYDQFHEVS